MIQGEMKRQLRQFQTKKKAKKKKTPLKKKNPKNRGTL